jgi:hypothetical protein
MHLRSQAAGSRARPAHDSGVAPGQCSGGTAGLTEAGSPALYATAGSEPRLSAEGAATTIQEQLLS